MRIIRVAIMIAISFSLAACKPNSSVFSHSDSAMTATAPTNGPIGTFVPTNTSMPIIVATPTKDVMAIDMAKLSHPMESMEDLKNNKDEFVISPFDPSVNYDGFIDWYSNLCSKLGDFTQMQVNFSLSWSTNIGGFYAMSGRNGKVMESKPLNFGVQIGDILYPAYIVVGEKEGNVQHPLTVIMIDMAGDGDFSRVDKAMRIIVDGGGELNGAGVRTEIEPMFPNVVDSLILQGLKGDMVGDEGFNIGFGDIAFMP